MAEDGSAITGRRPGFVPAEDPIAPVIPLIYEAALAPERWPAVLAALARSFGGSAAGLRAATAGAAPSITSSHGVEPGAIRSYDALWGALDPVTAAAGAGAAWGRPATARQAAGTALEGTPFFAGWMRPNGIDDDLCLSLLPPVPHRAVLGIARPPRRPRFGATEATALARLAPHLRRAVEVHRRLAAPLAAGPMAAALDRLAHAIVLADAGGAMAWANRAALALLAEADGIGLDRHGRLRAAMPAAARGAAPRPCFGPCRGGCGAAPAASLPAGRRWPCWSCRCRRRSASPGVLPDGAGCPADAAADRTRGGPRRMRRWKAAARALGAHGGGGAGRRADRAWRRAAGGRAVLRPRGHRRAAPMRSGSSPRPACAARRSSPGRWSG